MRFARFPKNRSVTATVGAVLLGLLVAAQPAGCSATGGNTGYKGSAHGWPSTVQRPATVTLVDSRTGEEIWTMDVPVGKVLMTKFRTGKGDDPVHRPDLLDYEVVDYGETVPSRYTSSISVPDADSRTWDLSIRPAPEYGPRPPRRAAVEPDDGG